MSSSLHFHARGHCAIEVGEVVGMSVGFWRTLLNVRKDK